MELAHRRWLVLGASALQMLVVGSLYAWSVFVAPLEQAYGIDRATASLTFSTAVACFTLTMLFGPRVYGSARPAALALATGVLTALSYVLAGAGFGPAALVLGYGILFGTANGIGYGLSLRLAQEALPTRPGLATGVVVASYTSGAILFAPIFAAGIGWVAVGDTLLLAGFGLGFLQMLVWAVFRGWDASGGAVQPPGPQPAPPLRDPVFAMLWGGFFAGSVTGVIAISHATGIAAFFGAVPAATAAAVSLVALGNTAGRLLAGWMSDRIQVRHLLTGTQALSAAGLAALLAWPGATLALIVLTLVGACYGALAGLYPVLVGRRYGAAHLPAFFGRLFTAWGCASAAGPYLAGLLFDVAKGYGPVLVVAAVTAAGASAFSAALPADALRRGAVGR